MEHDHSLSTRRIEMFSDGIFAIIVTLLVLDLKVPEVAAGANNQLMWKAIIPIIPQFISFALSFFILCIFWVNHHQFFYILKKADRKLLWLNNFLLFWLCFIPFPTAMLGRFPTNTIAVILFGSVMLMAATSFSIMSHYAMFRGKLTDEHIDKQEKIKAQRRSYWGISLYGISILLAPISVYISLAIFLIVPLLYFVPQKIKFS